DTLDGGAGNDRLDGGDGIDTASYASATAGVTVSLALTTAQNTAGAGSDTLAGIENLSGSSLADHLAGDAAANRLAGLAGLDTLTGGGAADTFVFASLSDSGATTAAADIVTDFAAGTDRMDLLGIDANSSVTGDQAFDFIGSDAFTAPGQ